MTGARIEIAFEDAVLMGALGRAIATCANPEQLLDVVGAVVEEGVQRRFETATDPDGVPWLESLRAREGESGGKTLTDTGRLQGSITRAVTKDSVAVGTNVIYGAIHQFGGEIVPKNAEFLTFTLASGEGVVTKSATMPARPFLGLDVEDRAGIADQVTRHFREALL